MEPEKWTHTIHRNGIILWSWNCHIVESYHWDHTKKIEPFQGDGIIPWDHTKEMESYHTIHRDFLTTFIYQNKSIQNKNM
jgi:hypothetical protein